MLRGLLCGGGNFVLLRGNSGPWLPVCDQTQVSRHSRAARSRYLGTTRPIAYAWVLGDSGGRCLRSIAKPPGCGYVSGFVSPLTSSACGSLLLADLIPPKGRAVRADGVVETLSCRNAGATDMAWKRAFLSSG